MSTNGKTKIYGATLGEFKFSRLFCIFWPSRFNLSICQTRCFSAFRLTTSFWLMVPAYLVRLPLQRKIHHNYRILKLHPYFNFRGSLGISVGEPQYFPKTHFRGIEPKLRIVAGALSRLPSWYYCCGGSDWDINSFWVSFITVAGSSKSTNIRFHGVALK